ncbi:hypothetical protein [Rhizobium phage RHEph12]|nr:hypothetical protein [Rhizobium phage RHEph12]
MNIIEAMALISAPRAHRLDTPRCVQRPARRDLFYWFDPTPCVGGQPWGFRFNFMDRPTGEAMNAFFTKEDFAADDWEECFPLEGKTRILGGRA